MEAFVSSLMQIHIGGDYLIHENHVRKTEPTYRKKKYRLCIKKPRFDLEYVVQGKRQIAFGKVYGRITLDRMWDV